MSFKVGVDLGGTKIAVAVLDPDNRTVFHQRRPTPAQDYAGIVDTIRKLIDEAHAAVPAIGDNAVGVGIPGALDSDNRLVKNANTQALIGKPLAADLRTVLNRKIVISNDANCFAASEATDGAAVGARIAFGVIIGTGVGGGMAIGARAWDGPNNLAGEWGHNPFPFFDARPNRQLCYCGKTDCIETVLSGPALARSYVEAGGDAVSAAEIGARVSAGDDLAAQVAAGYADNLAKALSTIVNIIDPDIIVLGGGVSNLAALYDKTPSRLRDYAFNASARPASIMTRLVKAHWGDDSGVRGAAWLTAK